MIVINYTLVRGYDQEVKLQKAIVIRREMEKI